MLKNTSVNLRMNSKTISHYEKLGYSVKVNEYYDILVDHLTKGSLVLVDVICDICGEEKSVQYKEYQRNISKHNIYTCSNKCALIKNQKTSEEKYGTSHYSKTKEFINRVKKTSLEKFGHEFYTQTDEYRKRIKETNKNRNYEIEYEKTKITNKLKYGNENYHQSDEYRNKQKDIVEKYKNTIGKKLLTKYDNLISTDNYIYKFLCSKGHKFEINRDLLKNRKKNKN